ncbi:MAG: NUDIX domain-containing protein, partial [Bacteroidia bacterium]
REFDFIYRAELDHELTEHEFDHVFVGYSDQNPNPDPSEVMDWKWIGRNELLERLQTHPEEFTAWFRIIAERVIPVNC